MVEEKQKTQKIQRQKKKYSCVTAQNKKINVISNSNGQKKIQRYFHNSEGLGTKSTGAEVLIHEDHSHIPIHTEYFPGSSGVNIKRQSTRIITNLMLNNNTITLRRGFNFKSLKLVSTSAPVYICS